MKHLYVIGARGYGREIYELFMECRHLHSTVEFIGFLDDKADALDATPGFPPIVSSVEDFIVKPDDVFVCALGDANYKRIYVQKILDKGGEFISLVHPTAYISATASVGRGLIMCAYSRLSCNTKAGDFVTIQPFCCIGHDAVIGDYSHLNTYAFMGGYAEIEDTVTLHTGAILLPYKKVQSHSIVGAGSVVTKNIESNITVFGSPAKKNTLLISNQDKLLS